ncbi:3-octaprenyl-4-hydroxybenzoate carboxy-lyase partner protein [Komagataeibacter europaeus]|uniref:Flavin prenyltransferase UbiX n=1 Tax=Komagataeibacter europaeus TaxID=33995 RepID=A0A0M0EKQ4_KOMEU|nr:UbiX family flavin prenyltransferase [Komagataeibacter europaeus]KON65833.1 3-octaprenyl-4-hydroxybenzoate carboxy-lyase partner protein [Komagataeibacter europaeus]GBQ40271.1 3-polyprenyl-4-hydroxybenzoate decarboxylase [Komagataeibacter europaeus LMG 18890]
MTDTTPVPARKHIIVGVTGASGFGYSATVLEILHDLGIETHLVISRSAMLAMGHETSLTVHDLKALADHTYDNRDIAAPVASGSFRTAGMIVVPCSAKTLAEIATGLGGNLISRAADVVLKERRRLVVMFRETPLHLGHCRNMVQLTEMGGIVMPPVPAFYPRPQSISDIIYHTSARIIDLFDLPVDLPGRWKEH